MLLELVIEGELLCVLLLLFLLGAPHLVHLLLDLLAQLAQLGNVLDHFVLGLLQLRWLFPWPQLHELRLRLEQGVFGHQVDAEQSGHCLEGQQLAPLPEELQVLALSDQPHLQLQRVLYVPVLLRLVLAVLFRPFEQVADGLEA